MITRNRGTAIIIALLAGHLGIHSLYLGNRNKTMTYLIGFFLSVLMSIFIIGWVGLIIIYSCVLLDVYKLAIMSDSEFNKLYNDEKV